MKAKSWEEKFNRELYETLTTYFLGVLSICGVENDADIEMHEITNRGLAATAIKELSLSTLKEYSDEVEKVIGKDVDLCPSCRNAVDDESAYFCDEYVKGLAINTQKMEQRQAKSKLDKKWGIK